MNSTKADTLPSSAEKTDGETVFDVRSIPCRVKHAQIFQRWLDLPVGSHFILLNDHDPIPLHYQFTAEFGQAFSWEYLQRGPEEFRVKIAKLLPVVAPGSLAPAGFKASMPVVDGKISEIDARGLEPPEPLVRILSALESLPAGLKLRAFTDREPCHLFGEVKQRGFRYECNEQPDGSWLTILARA